MRIGFLHASDAHPPVFDRLLAEQARRPLALGELRVQATHRVEAGLLAEATTVGLSGSILARVQAAVAALGPVDAALCTCSTLGPAAETGPRPALRIDRPMMAEAVRRGPRVLLVAALDTARASADALLAETARAMGRQVAASALCCAEAWPLFAAGDRAGFAAAVAERVRRAVAVDPPDVVVLAQASMADAAALLGDLDHPTLSSPRLAVDAVLARATAAVAARAAQPSITS